MNGSNQAAPGSQVQHGESEFQCAKDDSEGLRCARSLSIVGQSNRNVDKSRFDLYAVFCTLWIFLAGAVAAGQNADDVSRDAVFGLGVEGVPTAGGVRLAIGEVGAYDTLGRVRLYNFPERSPVLILAGGDARPYFGMWIEALECRTPEESGVVVVGWVDGEFADTGSLNLCAYHGLSGQLHWERSPNEGQVWGTSMAHVGDVDGDGVGDLAVPIQGGKPAAIQVLSGRSGLNVHSANIEGLDGDGLRILGCSGAGPNAQVIVVGLDARGLAVIAGIGCADWMLKWRADVAKGHYLKHVGYAGRVERQDVLVERHLLYGIKDWAAEPLNAPLALVDVVDAERGMLHPIMSMHELNHSGFGMSALVLVLPSGGQRLWVGNPEAIPSDGSVWELTLPEGEVSKVHELKGSRGLGREMSDIGDVNGDGVPDIGVAAYSWSKPSHRGRVIVLSGASGEQIWDLRSDS